MSPSPARAVRDLVVSLALSALGGIFFTVLFAQFFTEITTKLVLFGAISGTIIGLSFYTFEMVSAPYLAKFPPVTQGVLRTIVYLAAAFIGFSSGFTIASLILFGRSVLPFNAWYPIVIGGTLAAIVGLVNWSYLRMKERLEESLRRIQQQEWAERELELARGIQERLLPPQSIEGEGWLVAGRNLAARFVAGDFWDVVPLPDGKVAVFAGDVAGKGMGASLIMSTVKAMLPLLATSRDPAALLDDLDERLRPRLARREFVAMVVAVLDPADGTLEVANAGMPDPLHVRSAEVSEVVAPGRRFPVGAGPRSAYASCRVKLEPGDRLFLYSDGLPEATERGEQYGYEQLRRSAGSAIGGAAAPEEALDRLVSELLPDGVGELEDDWTAVVLERAREVSSPTAPISQRAESGR